MQESKKLSSAVATLGGGGLCGYVSIGKNHGTYYQLLPFVVLDRIKLRCFVSIFFCF